MCGDATAGVCSGGDICVGMRQWGCVGVSVGFMGGCGGVWGMGSGVGFRCEGCLGVLLGQCCGGGTWGVVDWGGKFFADAKTSTRRHYLPPAFYFQSVRILCEKTACTDVHVTKIANRKTSVNAAFTT